MPRIRRDLIKRHLYLVPNSIAVSRGCPHVCDFCYKEAFFEGGRSFYTQTVDAAIAEINGSFVFGMDADDTDVFKRTVEWAVEQGIETATFHILTPYPGTALHQRLSAQGRITSGDWDRYDTRHAVFRPARMTGEALEAGYWRAYRDFYRWSSILRGASAHDELIAGLRHLAYAAGWTKFEPRWDAVIRAKRAGMMLPVLEAIFSEFGRRSNRDGRKDRRHAA